jgi:hypothetical protein
MEPTKLLTQIAPASAETQDPDLYDAELTQVDTLRGCLVFSVNDSIHRVACPHVSSFSVGAIGRLRLPTEGREFAFNAYPDQRLRRAPSSDQPQVRRWGWRIGERVFTVEIGVIPGRAGKVIRRNTQRVSLELPSEFLDFCSSRKIAPERVLSTFIADLCALTNLYVCPREDGYTSSGSDERELAHAYFDRTWGIYGDESSPPRRGGKRGGTPNSKGVGLPPK